MKENILKGKIPYLISSAVIVVGILIIIAFLHTFQVQKKYNLNEFAYTVEEDTVGCIDSGDAGIFSYGSYADMGKGNYKVIITYDTDEDASFDVVYQKDGAMITLANGTLDHNNRQITATFYLEKPVSNQTFEIRTYYPGQGTFQLKEVQVRRSFAINPYIWISLVVILASVMAVCGRRILSVFKEPKAALYWMGFYTLLSCLAIRAMAYSQGKNEVAAYIIVNLLIVLHACGGKKEIYRDYFEFKTLVNAFCYAYLVCSFFALELLMRNLIFGNGNIKCDIDILNVFSFSVIGIIVLLLSLIPNAQIRAIFYGVVYYCFALLVAVHTVYFQVFGQPFSFQDIMLAKEGSNYISYVLSFFDGKFILLLLGLLIAGIVGIFLAQKTVMIRKEWGLWIGAAVLSLIFYSHTFYPAEFGGWNSFADDNYIYAMMSNRQRVFELCGYYQYEMKDLKKFLFGHHKADRRQRQEIKDFFNQRAGEENRGENAMTGLFEGKNVIFVLMESIDDIACNDEVMPNLSRMTEEGINFSNMYAPIYGSAATLNSELVTNVGLYAPVDGSLVYSFADNHFPYSLAERFTERGYTARQYHFNVAGYYDRNLLNKAFGYKEYVSFLDYAGEECTLDTILVENDEIYHKLTENGQYFDYIISYSAHLPYDDAGQNVQYAIEKYPQYTGLTGFSEIDHYFAKARITDDMLGELMQRLEGDGLLENTVIVAIGDHFPYGIMDRDTLYQLSGVDCYEQLLYKVPCVIWTPEMEPVEISKTAASNDLVPTLVNLMGFGDCSMYIGQDIFDEAYEGYAYCADGSWISGDCYYHEGKLICGSMEQEQIDEMNRKVMDKITVNDLILHTDYYVDYKRW